MNRLRDRLQFFVWLLVLALAAVARVDAAAGAQPVVRADATVGAQPVVRRVDSIGITVGDMQRSLEFYTKVLPFERVSGREIAGDGYEHLYGVFGARVRVERLRLGDEYIELQQFLAPAGRPVPVDSRSNDRWFQHVAIIVSDMDRAYDWLRGHGVGHASTGPQLLPAWNPNAGGIAAFYFRDPDGHPLEILHFPAGKGADKWQRPAPAGRNPLFLGIDHTAIVVSDTDASLRFYRDALGLAIAGTSENYGVEQERLNNVFGARLRITALRAAGGGPGIELLEYLAPRTGRPAPSDTQANDLWHWQVNVDADVGAADRAVRAGHYAYVSPGVVDVGAAAVSAAAKGAEAVGATAVRAAAVGAAPVSAAAVGAGIGAGVAEPGDRRLMARDPDGHALLFQAGDPREGYARQKNVRSADDSRPGAVSSPDDPASAAHRTPKIASTADDFRSMADRSPKTVSTPDASPLRGRQ
jgi:catechol 2,3-dioxygenase-like lactoylglutathione lyase family enzyme